MTFARAPAFGQRTIGLNRLARTLIKGFRGHKGECIQLWEMVVKHIETPSTIASSERRVINDWGEKVI